MTYNDAKKKMESLANGKYHTLTHNTVISRPGVEKVEIMLYLDGYPHTPRCPTWESALGFMISMIAGTNLDADQSPE